MGTQRTSGWAMAALVGLLGVAAPPPAAAQPGQQRLYAYASAGDNQWVSDWPPLDSQATVEAMIEWLSATYGVKRLYWRGEQDRMWLDEYRFRPEIPLYYDFWTNWLRRLTYKVGTDDIAVAAAHRRGMEIYIFDGLFEHAAQGDAGGCGMFPYQCEDSLRIEHPEWCPVDRWGERLCPGPLEFCYPEARRALVARYVRQVTKYRYDGISFYTYVENTGVRYLDEFGFNEPIVQEFKRRHGVDIRTEPFDKEAWHRLRGEYLTEFLRELHTALSAKGRKLSVTLRPDQPNCPQRWYGTGVDLPGAGMVYMDWETWVKEGLVDEVFVWHGGDPNPLLGRLLEATRGKPVELVSFSSSPFAEHWQPLLQSGITPCTVTAPGYGIDRSALEPTSPGTLASPDWRLRVQTLTDIAAGTVSVAPATVASLASDPHPRVRREALRTLGALKAGDQVKVLEDALADREPSVRVAAASALAAVYGPGSPRRLLAAVHKDDGFQLKEASINALAAMKADALGALIDGARSRSRTVREVCVRALGKTGLDEARPPLLAALAADPDYRIRFHALGGLAGDRTTAVTSELLRALRDPTPTVQLAAAKALGERAGAFDPGLGAAVLAELGALFRQYGDGCKRADAAWGWRPVGNAILACGAPGKELLDGLRTQAADRWLAWAAYQVVHVPQVADRAITCDEKDAVATHAAYAPPFPGRRR